MATRTQAAKDDGLFDPGADAILSRLTQRLKGRTGLPGPIAVETKKTCIHLVAGEGGTAFLGIHPRKAGLLLTIRTTAPIKSPRIRKFEQASANRFHNDLLLTSSAEIDAELLGWIAESYRLAAKIDA